MNQFDVEIHDCGDYLNAYMLRGTEVGRTVPCRCNNLWTLLPEKSWRYLAFWRVREAQLADTLWWRDLKSERRDRRIARKAAKEVAG